MRKILVVEDEEAIREVVGLNLRLAGYEVYEAASAEEALSVFKEHNYVAWNERLFPMREYSAGFCYGGNYYAQRKKPGNG